jgi:hypothetical protein
MAVYVDIAIWERHDRRWCHLLADDEDELHAFAAGLGIERRRFQTRPARPWIDHYDIDEPRRTAAIERGAIELDRREVVRLIARKRAATLAARPWRPAAKTERAQPSSDTASPTATRPGSTTAP